SLSDDYVPRQASFLFLSPPGPPPHLHSFTTRRSSDLDATVEVEVDGKPKQFSPPEISAMILAKLKTDAEMRLGEKITQAVITVPDRKSTRLNSSHVSISYAVFCLKNKK